MNSDELSSLKKEINQLKAQKRMKRALATSKSEKVKLQAEIRALDNMGKSESKLKSFGKTFARGIKVTGRTLFRGIKAGSKNLNKNAPEYREFSRGMMTEPNQSLTRQIYAPRPRSMRLKKQMRKMRIKFRRKGKYLVVERRKVMARQPIATKRMPSMESWELP